jgi:hypothetical protein
MEKTITAALEAAQELTVTLYTALREDVHLHRDYQLAIALQRPCFALISALASMAETSSARYREKRLEMAKENIAVISAILETVQKAAALEDETHSMLLTKLQGVQAAMIIE